MNAIEKRIEELLGQLTLEEKASLCSGQDEWTTKPVDRLDIPSIWVSDGPHGLRKAPTGDVGGFGDQHPSTCFPTASALAATWDTELIRELGKHLAVECRTHDVDIILGPGVNIKRSPTGGRNFEYFSEDPILAGELGAAYIQGVQVQGVGTSLKHFACNNQETQRMLTSADIDERTLREIYLSNFEIAVKKGRPWTVMAAYNPVNGIDSTANKILLNDILKREWGFEGIVISDWVSVYDRVAGIKAGMHVEMPGNDGVNDKMIVEAVKSGNLDPGILDDIVRDILRIVFKAESGRNTAAAFNEGEHHSFARKVAGEAIVLLKNENAALPITVEKYRKIAVLGEFAVNPRFQGNGSSEVKPTHIDSLREEMLITADEDFRLEYARGYNLGDDNDMSFIREAVDLASRTDVVVLHVGLPSEYESEGYDRKHIDIPPSQVRLIDEVANVQNNVVVVLTNGAAIAMPWLNRVSAVVETWLGGQAGGGAIVDVLFGQVNPSGKLPETFPVRMEDTPAYLDFPGVNRSLRYGEGIFVGYRWYDKRDIEPLFPFGFGLSYTSFEYSGIELSKKKMSEDEKLNVSCTIRNTGSMTGKEIVQLYVTDRESRLIRPDKELKDFVKIELAPGEQSIVNFELTSRDFSYYNDAFGAWVVESGDFNLSIGASSRDIRLVETLTFSSAQLLPVPFDERTSLREWITYPETRELIYPLLESYFLERPDDFEGDLMDFRLKNDFYLDMPVMKYVQLSHGRITQSEVSELVIKAGKLKVRL